MKEIYKNANLHKETQVTRMLGTKKIINHSEQVRIFDKDSSLKSIQYTSNSAYLTSFSCEITKTTEKVAETEKKRTIYLEESIAGKYDLIYRFNEEILDPSIDIKITKDKISISNYKDIDL